MEEDRKTGHGRFGGVSRWRGVPPGVQQEIQAALYSALGSRQENDEGVRGLRAEDDVRQEDDRSHPFYRDSSE